MSIRATAATITAPTVATPPTAAPRTSARLSLDRFHSVVRHSRRSAAAPRAARPSCSPARRPSRAWGTPAVRPAAGRPARWPGQRGGDAEQPEQGEGGLGPVRPQRLPPPRLLAGLRRDQERCLRRTAPSTDARATTREVDCQIRNAPSASRQDAPVPRRSSATARTSPSRTRTGTVATRNAVSFRNSSPPPVARFTAPASRNTRKIRPSRSPYHCTAPGQVGPALTGTEPVLLGRAAGQQRAPVHPQDLDAAEAPAVSLALERLEGQRHDAPGPRTGPRAARTSRPAAAAATARRPR